MRDSLLSRFRGAFLGALLGEAIGANSSTLPQPPKNYRWHKIEQAQLRGLLNSESESGIRSMVTQTEQLLKTVWAGDRCSSMSSSETQRVDRSIVIPQAWGSVGLAIAVLPTALFYHDEPNFLQSWLQKMPDNQYSAEAVVGATVISHTVSLLLRERSPLVRLIPQVLKDLDLSSEAPLTEQLLQVQSWIEQPTELATVAHWIKYLTTRSPSLLNSLPIALSLYSFLSTPDHFQISQLRLAQLPDQMPLTHTLTGALSGLYNGLTGIPLAWQQQVRIAAASELTASKVSEQWQISPEAELWQIADRLLAAWSGVTQTADWSRQSHTHITAAPRVIRSS